MSYKFITVGVNKITDPSNVLSNVTLNFTGTNGDSLVTRSTEDILLNKTITGLNNYVGANELKTTGDPVFVSGSAPPKIGQVLTAKSGTNAVWSNTNLVNVLCLAPPKFKFTNVDISVSNVPIGNTMCGVCLFTTKYDKTLSILISAF